MKTLQNTDLEGHGETATACYCQPLHIKNANAHMGFLKRLAKGVLPTMLVLAATVGGALAGPYQSKIAVLDGQYKEGRISLRSYRSQRADLEILEAEYNQRNREQALDTVKTLTGLIVPFIPRPGFGPRPHGPGPGRPGPGGPGPRR